MIGNVYVVFVLYCLY